MQAAMAKTKTNSMSLDSLGIDLEQEILFFNLELRTSNIEPFLKFMV
jgi:hypothetical protein